jgi:hypothetical protein
MARGMALALAFTLIAAWPAWGAKPKDQHAPEVQAVIDCRAIDDAAKRLACYDQTVAKMSAAEANGDLVTINREQRRAARRQAFGLPLPSLAFLDRGEKPDEVDKIEVKIASASQGGVDAKWTIVLDDGAIWRQIDSNELHRAPHAGSTAVIRRAMLGSFFMNIDGQQAIRVHRVQ